MRVQDRLYTVDEFEAFIVKPENRDRLFELVNGGIVEKEIPEYTSLIIGAFFAQLWNFVKPRKLGRLVLEVRYRVKDDRHNDRIPDIAFTRTERLQPVVERGPTPTIPDLCIEVQSPDDSPREMRDKATYYLANGAQLVLLVYPKKRMIEALYPNGEFDIYREGDTLTFGDLLPDFELAVSDVFEP